VRLFLRAWRKRFAGDRRKKSKVGREVATNGFAKIKLLKLRKA